MKRFFFTNSQIKFMQLSKADFLAEAEKLYDNLQSNLDSERQSFYDYEATFVQLSQQFAVAVLEKSIGQKTAKERKKKSKAV